MTRPSRFAVPLSELEASAHVSQDEQVEEQVTHEVREYVAPEDLDRARLLSPASAGRLRQP